jgi:hypothetical protein
MKNNTEASTLEILSIVYDKVAEHHKYYLSWRHYLLAGYFVAIAFLFYASFYLIENGNPYSKFAFLIPIVIGFVSRFFLLMDKRNMDLYHVCQNVGERIEKKLFNLTNKKIKSNHALFNVLSGSYKKFGFTHSQLIGYLYNSVSWISIILSICLFFFLTLNCCPEIFK